MLFQGKLQEQFQFKHTYDTSKLSNNSSLMMVIMSADPTHAGRNLCELLPVSALSED